MSLKPSLPAKLEIKEGKEVAYHTSKDNPPSAKRSGEEESALNNRREKIRQSRKKKSDAMSYGKEASEMGKVWPLSY